MAKINISLCERTEEADKKLPKQATEILAWMNTEYGANTPVDQAELLKALDSHQEDNAVLTATPRQPISRIWAFYRKRLADEGYITMEKIDEPKAAKAEGEDSDNTEKKVSKRRRKDAPVADAGDEASGIL